MLIVFVILNIVQTFGHFMMIVVGRQSFFAYQAFQLMNIGFIVLNIVVGLVFLLTKSWPKIVSFVLFASVIGRFFSIFQYYFIRSVIGNPNFLTIYSTLTFVVYLLSLGLTATMLYVLYYEQEPVQKSSYEEGYY